MDKNVIEDLMTLVSSGKSVGDSMADMIMGGIRAESDRKEADKNRHKQICGDKVSFDTGDMVFYLNEINSDKFIKCINPDIYIKNMAYLMGFSTREGKITKKGLKFLRNNA